MYKKKLALFFLFCLGIFLLLSLTSLDWVLEEGRVLHSFGSPIVPSPYNHQTENVLLGVNIQPPLPIQETSLTNPLSKRGDDTLMVKGELRYIATPKSPFYSPTNTHVAISQDRDFEAVFYGNFSLKSTSTSSVQILTTPAQQSIFYQLYDTKTHQVINPSLFQSTNTISSAEVSFLSVAIDRGEYITENEEGRILSLPTFKLMTYSLERAILSVAIRHRNANENILHPYGLTITYRGDRIFEAKYDSIHSHEPNGSLKLVTSPGLDPRNLATDVGLFQIPLKDLNLMTGRGELKVEILTYANERISRSYTLEINAP